MLTKEQRQTRDKEIARRNGAKSKGPKTPEGKHASSANALQHGLCAKGACEVITGESKEIFQSYQSAFYSRFQPADDVERILIDQMICSAWRLNRIVGYEVITIETEIEEMTPEVDEHYETIGGLARGALAFRQLADTSHSLHLINRYETTLRRTYHMAARELRQLQQESRLRNEPATVSTSIESTASEPATT